MNILGQGYEDNDRDFRLEQFEKDKNMLAFWLQKQEDAQRAVDVANTNIEYLTKLIAGKIGRTALRPEDETE